MHQVSSTWAIKQNLSYHDAADLCLSNYFYLALPTASGHCRVPVYLHQSFPQKKRVWAMFWLTILLELTDLANESHPISNTREIIYLHLTVYSLSFLSRVVNMWWIALGMTPATFERFCPSSLSLSPPSIVYVLPVPVCPYAKMVQLKPSKTSSTIGAMAWLYNLSCPESGPNTYIIYGKLRTGETLSAK